MADKPLDPDLQGLLDAHHNFVCDAVAAERARCVQVIKRFVATSRLHELAAQDIIRAIEAGPVD